jgi:hypothetical protein
VGQQPGGRERPVTSDPRARACTDTSIICARCRCGCCVHLLDLGPELPFRGGDGPRESTPTCPFGSVHLYACFIYAGRSVRSASGLQTRCGPFSAPKAEIYALGRARLNFQTEIASHQRRRGFMRKKNKGRNEMVVPIPAVDVAPRARELMKRQKAAGLTRAE